MRKVSNDSIGGRGVTLLPSNGEYKNVVVFLHGLGDDASGWSSVMHMLDLDKVCYDCKWNIIVKTLNHIFHIFSYFFLT